MPIGIFPPFIFEFANSREQSKQKRIKNYWIELKVEVFFKFDIPWNILYSKALENIFLQN